jgi:hypothetical protein
MRTIDPAALAALCVALACCAPKPPPPSPTPPAPKAAQGIDGEYRGTSTRFQAGSRACPHPGLVTLQVTGRTFQYRWDHDTWVDATIAPDGSVAGGAERITLAGRQSGPRIEGDVTDGTCGLHFTLNKRS